MFGMHPMDSVRDVIKSIGFDILEETNGFSLRLDGSFCNYHLYVNYDEEYSSVNFDVFIPSFEIDSARLSVLKDKQASLKLRNRLMELVSYANSTTPIGHFLIINNYEICFRLALPFVYSVDINSSSVKRILDTIMVMCDRFVPGFAAGFYEKKFDFGDFLRLTDPCLCKG